MICPSCGGDTYVRRTQDDRTKPQRIRRCLRCSLEFKTLELYESVVEGQARQASYFQTMVSDESRAKAKDIIKQNGGTPNGQ